MELEDTDDKVTAKVFYMRRDLCGIVAEIEDDFKTNAEEPLGIALRHLKLARRHMANDISRRRSVSREAQQRACVNSTSNAIEKENPNEQA